MQLPQMSRLRRGCQGSLLREAVESMKEKERKHLILKCFQPSRVQFCIPGYCSVLEIRAAFFPSLFLPPCLVPALEDTNQIISEWSNNGKTLWDKLQEAWERAEECRVEVLMCCAPHCRLNACGPGRCSAGYVRTEVKRSSQS